MDEIRCKCGKLIAKKVGNEYEIRIADKNFKANFPAARITCRGCGETVNLDRFEPMPLKA